MTAKDKWTQLFERRISRRDFLKLAGSSLTFAGLSCTQQPLREIVPYVHAPEEFIPGKPRFFATAVPRGGFGYGVIVESHLGRPTKIEGNPEHPSTLGGSDVFMQASILDLYDPDRSKKVICKGAQSTWPMFISALKTHLGDGFHLLTGPVSSPTLIHQIDQLLKRFPGVRWHVHDPVSLSNLREGLRLAIGRPAEADLDFSRAKTIVSLDADFLKDFPGSLTYARQFIRARTQTGKNSAATRLYAIESRPSHITPFADRRLLLRPSEIPLFGLLLAKKLGALTVEHSAETLPPECDAFASHLVRQLRQDTGKSLVLAGPAHPPVLHALCCAINSKLANIDRTIRFIEPVGPGRAEIGIEALVKEMQSGRAKALLILEANPVYSSGQTGELSKHLTNLKFSACFGTYENETSALCHWHLPASHFLETWGDIRGHEGTATILQPMLQPLYDTRSAIEVLALTLGNSLGTSEEVVKSFWRQRNPALNWQKAVQDGIIPGTKSKSVTAPIRLNRLPTLQFPSDDFELILQSDPTVGDGTYSNNGWLQELPKPLTRITWDNAVHLSPDTAARLGVFNEELVNLNVNGKSLTAPVWILPGLANNTALLTLGYGRTKAGRNALNRGYNAFAISSPSEALLLSGAKIVRTAGHHPFARAQQHQQMEGRKIVQTAPVHHEKAPVSLYPEHKNQEPAWGMVIDLSACIGCGACVVACQAENNIPVVGQKEIARNHSMHWLRVDSYFEGDPKNPRIHFQPVPCMHCEKAPCELVCPTAATVHDHSGLNQMVYNRCVGTRYCSNNCPYKVRRFNFFEHSDLKLPTFKMLENPDVTIRSRGVMEKCTYCIQRISAARINARKENRSIADGEIQTACQQACPTHAILFGNLKDPQSQVAKLRNDARNYGLLSELGTRPRTTYLAKLRSAVEGAL